MGTERLLTVSELLLLLACIRHYSPRRGRRAKPRLAPRSGDFTPPRISPSCPHCMWLWLDRGTIVGERGCGETACQSRFWMDGPAGHLHWPSFTKEAEGEAFSLPSFYRRWSWRILRIAFPVYGLTR